MMMSIPELDKAKRTLSALQECHDLVYAMAKGKGYTGHYVNVLNDIQNRIDETESEILSIEKNYGGE